MSFLYDQQKVHQQKLERFRQSFLILTQDGQYPPERQNRLYQATIDAGLDWNEARQFVHHEAENFFRCYQSAVVDHGSLTPDVLAELHRLRRRLGLGPTITEDLVRLKCDRPGGVPARSVTQAKAPSFWSDLKMVIGGFVMVPIIWIGMVFLTILVLFFLSIFMGSNIISRAVVPISLFEFPLAISFSIRLVRRWRGQRRYQYRPSPARPYNPPPLPINQYATHTHRQPPHPLSGSALAGSVQHLSGPEFEHWVKDRLAELGWQQLRVMGGRGDRGVDIRGIYHGKKCIVQCKHYRGRLVPPGEVRALVGTRNIQRAQRAYLVTSGAFGYQCFQEVLKKPVELWDLETLATHLNNQSAIA